MNQVSYGIIYSMNGLKRLERALFFGGNTPHIVDLAVFGYMQSIEMHSKAFRLIESHSKGMSWFNRMRDSLLAQ